MTAFLTWLPDVLRNAGVDVYVMPGAERRTTQSRGLAVRGIVWHHTATGPNWQDGHVASLLAKGRTDLAGPLAQVGIERDGTWVIVALGRANHNGYGTWGNDSLGLEFYNSGVGEPWPDVQVRSGVVGSAAVLTYLGKHVKDVLGHRETDPRRKIDPAGLDMSAIRRSIDAHMRRPTPAPEPVPALEDLMSLSVDGRQLVTDTYEAAGRKTTDAGGRAYWTAMLACTDEPAERRNVINSLRSQLKLDPI